MSANQCVEVSFFLSDKVNELLPGAFNYLELAKRLHLSYKMDHLRHHDSDLVPVKVEI
jgi:hypothetical protein